MFPIFNTEITYLFITAIAAYLLGSIPFGLILTRFMGLGNLRNIGSGNIGATNVLRTGNKFAAFLTLLFDAGKGAIPVLIAHSIFQDDAAQIAGFFAFLGHCFPVWLNFKGGKGVATFLGIILALNWPTGIAACLTWLLVSFFIRISSAAALIAVLSTPLWFYLFKMPNAIGFSLILASLIWLRHHENIVRILTGNEPKIGKK